MNKFFAQWREEKPSWQEGHGPAADLVMATKASLARNVAGFSFPVQAKLAELTSVQEELHQVLPHSTSLAGGHVMDLAQLTQSQRGFLQEQQMVSDQTVKNPLHQILHSGPDGQNWALVNGEDHLLLETMESGFEPKAAVEKVLEIESSLEGDLAFAYREDLGYITSRPGQVGCALRLSALVHLPGLVLADEIDKILNAMRQLRFSVLGMFGSGKAVRGAMFRISSLVTLGRDEQEIADDFSYHVGKVLVHEKSAREQLYARDRLWLEDQVQRSYALLRSAKMITAQETMDRLSHLRLGVSLGIVPEISWKVLNEVLLGHQSAHLELEQGIDLENREKSLARASFLQEKLGTV